MRVCVVSLKIILYNEESLSTYALKLSVSNAAVASFDNLNPKSTWKEDKPFENCSPSKSKSGSEDTLKHEDLVSTVEPPMM